MADINKYIVAMDIGTSNIVALLGEKAENGKVRIIDVTDVPASGIARGDVRNVEQVVASISKVVAQIEEKLELNICEAYVGLSGEHINCSQHGGYVFIKNRDSEVAREDVNELSDSMRNVKVQPGQTIIHILPQNYILDGDSDISHPVGMIGKKLEGKFNIVMGEKLNLNHLERCLNRTNIGITEVILSSLASAESVLLDDEKELGVIVVDIGGGTCDICVYYDKTVRYMGVIPLGGNNINKDIKSFGVLERYVEKLKLKFGSAMSETVPDNKVITLASINNIPSKEIAQKSLASIIEARMMDIIDGISDILNHSNFNEKLKGPIVLTGGCSNLKDLDKLFEKHLKRDVRIATPTLYVTDDSVDKVNNPRYSTAVGLLLKGLVVGKSTKVSYIKQPVPVNQPNPNTQYGFNPYNAQDQQQQQQQTYADRFINQPIDKDIDEEDELGGMPDIPEYNPAATHESNGISKWLKRNAKKVREMFDNEGLEDDKI